MNMQEKATLRELFTEITHLGERMDDRFDALEERVRAVEATGIRLETTDVVRKEHRVGIRWGISSIISVVGIAAAVSSVVVTVILRVFF